MEPGGWLGGEQHLSPELEESWGPSGAATQHPAVSDVRDAGAPFLAPPTLAPPGDPPGEPAGRPSARRRWALVAGVLVAVLVVGGLVASGGGSDPEPTVAAGGDDPAPAADPGLADSAEAFLERWNAGPSTTMPLGAAGVPAEERPTTTTVARPPAQQQPGAQTTGGVASGPGGGGRYEQDDPSDEEDWADADADADAEDEPDEPPTLAADDPRLRGAEQVAQQFVDAFVARDCEGVWALLSTPTLALFAEADAEEGISTKDTFCQELQTEEIPAIVVHPPARPYHDGAQVDTEADGEVDPLVLLLEGDRWTVDLLGDAFAE